LFSEYVVVDVDCGGSRLSCSGDWNGLAVDAVRVREILAVTVTIAKSIAFTL